MAGALRKIDPLFQLRQELLKACDNILFEVHQGPPPFWNGELDQKLEAYLAPQPRCSFSTCPICGHKLEATQAPPDFHDPWWLYPQKSFQDAKTCSHFELLTFSILWSHAEPMAPPWLIPCGWGVPALSESLSHDENLAVSIKTTSLGNGAIIFWMGLFRKQPGIPLASDFWSLPTLKTRAPIHPTLNSRGFWGEFSPISTQTPFIWSQIHFEQSDGRLINYEDQKSLENLAPKLRHWSLMTYNQPLKMYKDRFVSESGFASFAIGMRSTRTKGALFISQTPIVAGHFQAPPRPLKIAQPKHSHPHFQGLSIQQMQDLAQTDTLWALIDPFQNETTQDWLRLIRPGHFRLD